MAKSILPLSKLCALVTMQRQHPSEAEMFSLPLFLRTDFLTGNQSMPSGMHKHTHPQSNMYCNILQLNLKLLKIITHISDLVCFRPVRSVHSV